jgi:F-box-like
MWWSPEEGSSLPKEHERGPAAQAINSMKEELKITLARADRLKYEILKRTAWLAPIRRIPSEVLSLIFVQACKENWKDLVNLEAVCRHWRNVLLSTPRAWAFVLSTPSISDFPIQQLNLWLSRCGNLNLHINLHPATSPDFVEALCFHKKSRNIRCLSLFNNSKQLRCTFRRLEELRLGPEFLVSRWATSHDLRRKIRDSDDISLEEEEEDPYDRVYDYDYYTDETTYEELREITSLLDVERFPRLLSLHLHGPSFSTVRRIAREKSFPRLQNLHLRNKGEWLLIVERCKDTLITLAIDFVTEDTPHEVVQHTVTLPRLTSLSYVLDPTCTLKRTNQPPIRTPILQTYREINGPGVSPIHSDVLSVKEVFLQDCSAVDWSFFPSLTHLRLEASCRFIETQLMSIGFDGMLCPNLAFLECSPSGPGVGYDKIKLEAFLIDRLGSTGNLKEFKHSPESNPKAGPYQVWTPFRLLQLCANITKCFTFCQCHLPSQYLNDVYKEAEDLDNCSNPDCGCGGNHWDY